MKRALAICLSSLFASTAFAADLTQVYRDALANDAKFSAARAQFEAGQEKVVQGRAGLLPVVAASATTTWNDVSYRVSSASSDYTYNSNGYAVQLTQPLFRWQNWVQYKQGELQTALAGSQYGQARQDLILRTAEAYFNVLNAEDALAAVSQLRTAAAEQLEIAKTSFEVGTVTITDVHEAQSRFDLASAQEIAARNDLDVRRESLAQIIGKEPEPLAGLRTGVELQRPQPDNIGEWVSAAEQGSFGVQAQQLAREIATREISRANAGHMPTLDLVATHSLNNRPSVSYDRSESTTVGLQLNVPLYQGGGVSSREREAAALKLKADADLEDARRSAALAARQSYLGVTSGMAQVRALEAARLSSTSALEANKLGYEVGVRINIDVLNAQSQLADTLQKLSRARYDTLLAQLRLKAAAGTLGEEDVRAINALLAER
ncbi:MAG: channel protein TolC [Betaproteobacteria bacterium HGW-Betaproteobacteria-13]|jgi:outer membrane protein|uniref:Channel protein TolC n=1 Tax=Parazoarcus communis TaxID=41977 RepID=A0A2U8GYF3_9RHOO|nr:TolC family outer membrane protein [Parazoarcus communis]AWI78474.1 channel protein TolC [Parazoarcus communis]PKO59373.1 MAG: channel protein TolC [Betaproteobacteria bacterium HGW-Betaproteobacteria-19]PKO78299.1 MAG: channel protein TolC [Betaproteobacteria bacterium HGW-Betaproteobacteria-13]